MKTYSSQGGGETFKESDCGICGSGDSNPYLDCGRFTYYRCQNCGFVFQNPQPDPKELLLRYGQEYFNYELENDNNFYSLMVLALRDVDFDSLEAEIDRRIEKTHIGQKNSSKTEKRASPGEKRFLDVGCATGMLVEHMQKRGWKAEGVEVCRESAEYGMVHRKVSIRVGTLFDAKYPSHSFDVVNASHLIEHLPDLKGFFQEVKRVLVLGGYFIVTTPNCLGFQARLYKDRWRSAIADHVVLFSKPTLTRLAAETGFTREQYKTWGGIAKGAAPLLVKKVLDWGAKVFGYGDVMVMRLRKPG